MKYTRQQLRDMSKVLIHAANYRDPRYDVFINLVAARASVPKSTVVGFIVRHYQERRTK